MLFSLKPQDIYLSHGSFSIAPFFHTPTTYGYYDNTLDPHSDLGERSAPSVCNLQHPTIVDKIHAVCVRSKFAGWAKYRYFCLVAILSICIPSSYKDDSRKAEKKSQDMSPSRSKAHLRLRSDSHVPTFANLLATVEEAAAECLSEDALVHLKSYKYSSVDKSYISNYILKHYVC